MSLDNQLDTINELKAAIKSLEERIAHLEAELKQNIKVSDTNKLTATITKANGDTAIKKDTISQKEEIESGIIETTDFNFDENVLKNSKPVLSDFWATWCQPCLMLAPVLKEIAEEMKDQISVTKHNIDEHPNQPTKYGVKGLPTMLLFKDGELKATKVGTTTKSNIVSWIKENI